jgi:tRNA uridine 5-carbamoylmethylation protein Kti12
MKRWFSNGVTVAINQTMKASMTQEKISYCETDITEYIKSQFLMANITAKRSVFGKFVNLSRGALDVSDIIEFVSNLNKSRMISTAVSTRLSQMVNEDNTLMVSIKTSSTSIEVELLGELALVTFLEKSFIDNYESIPCSIEWITSTDMNSVLIPLFQPIGITDDSYPFIEGGLDNLVEKYLNGPENILLLIGPPGTGKTNLIKHIISKSKRGAMVTYDPLIMAKDSIFANFAESDAGTLVFEDADNLLGTRASGNEMMVKFLNSSDGLVSAANKKMIFSTNLENLNDVDPALTRPGRCAGVIRFRALDHVEILKFLAVNKNIAWRPTDQQPKILAEIYNHSEKNRDTGKRKAAFY